MAEANQSDYESQWLGKVFCNSLILKKILVYLSLDEINTLRSVTSEINQDILSCKRFKNNAVLVISEKSVQAGVLNRSGIKWKNVKVELYDGIGNKAEDKKAIRDLLDNHVEFLNLTGDTDHPISFLDEIYNKENRFPLFMDKIEKPLTFKNLTTFHIHSYILNGLKLRESPFLTDSVLKNLKKLKLYYYESNLKLYSPMRETDNLAYISENCKSLVEFSIERIVESHIDASAATKKSLLDIITSNAPALVSLYIEDEIMWSMREISEIKFPVLKHCGIRCTVANENNALTFLRNLNPNLESLSVVFNRYLPITILKAIRDKSKSLKKLHVKSPQLGLGDNDSEENEKRHNLWDFLQDMEHLDDFSLIEPCNSEYNQGLIKYQHLLRILPKNVQKITIRGMFNEQVVLSVVPSLSFDNLTVLNLLRCSSCLDDADLQHICSKMTKLVRLMFSHADLLSDAGITGLSKDDVSGQTIDSRVSISNLKGLKLLTMRDCSLLTPAILGSISFKFLTDLNLGNNKVLSVPVFIEYSEKVLAQNPLLRRITLSESAPWDQDALIKKLTDISGVRCSVCFVSDNWPTTDSDIDADDDSMYNNDHDSDISGGGYPGHDHDDFGFSDENDDDDDDQFDY